MATGRRRLFLIPLLAVAMGLLLAATPANAAPAAPSHPFLFTLEGNAKTLLPPPEGEFEDACGVAVDSLGDLYVSDYYHHLIDVYNSSHTYLTQIHDPDPDGPCNLAVDSAGHLYVDHWHRDVVRYTPSAYPPSASTIWGAPTAIDSARSTGVALDPATGDVYVDDRTYVARYEPSGALIGKIGEGNIGSGYGVAVSNFPGTQGDVYVADATTNTVKVFGPAGVLVGEVDGAGTPQAGFTSLADSDVAVDPAGHLYVADNLEPGFEHPRAVVDEFNPAGAYRGQLPRTITDAEPTALATDSLGNVYATSGNDEEAVLFGFGPTLPAHALTVTESGGGAGTVTSEPAGINCGSACTAEYNAGEEVVLTGVPAPGSVFAGFSGACSGTAPCHLQLVADATVTAEFEPAPPAPLAIHQADPVSAAPAGAAVSVAGASSAALRLSAARIHGSGATLQVTVPGPGTLSLTGAGLRPASAKASDAGPLRLRAQLDRHAARALRRAKGRTLALLATVIFTPDQGAPGSAGVVIHFKRTKGSER